MVYFRMLDKRGVKRAFNLSHGDKLSDKDFEAYGGFIIGTMLRSGVEAKDWGRDYAPFYWNTRPKWRALYGRYVQDRGIWPVFDKPGVMEFVQVKTQKVVESLPYPNEYAEGPDPDRRPPSASGPCCDIHPQPHDICIEPGQL